MHIHQVIYVMKAILLLAFSCFALCSGSLQAKVSEKEKFAVRVIKVERTERGCSASVLSVSVRYHISSVSSGACAFLRAGESYKAFIFRGHPKDAEPDDQSEPKVWLVIEDNKTEGSTSVFDIDSEEVENKKQNSSSALLGDQGTAESSEPLPVLAHKRDQFMGRY